MLDDHKLLQQDQSSQKSEYLLLTLLSGLLQVPLLLAISELILIDKQASAFEVAYAMCVIQLVAICLYFWKMEMYVFDVPVQGRYLLVTRSLIYCIGFVMFMKSMEFLNPVVSLISHQLGLYSCTVLYRMFGRAGMERWWVIACIKFMVTGYILL